MEESRGVGGAGEGGGGAGVTRTQGELLYSDGGGRAGS